MSGRTSRAESLSRDLLSHQARALMSDLESRRSARRVPEFQERVRLSREELVGQPAAISETLAHQQDQIRQIAKAIAKDPPARIYCVGCGDSYISALAARYAFEQLVRIPFVVIQALDYTRYYCGQTDAKTLIIALSSSGVVPRTAEALLKAKEMGAKTIGVTNTPDTPLTDLPTHHIMVRARRMGGCPTQASTGAIAALFLFALELASELHATPLALLQQRRAELDNLPALVADAITRFDEPMLQLAAKLKRNDCFFFAGGGPSFATAAFGAAKVKEMSQDYAVAMPLEEYHHYDSLKQGEPLFLVSPKGLGDDRALDTARDAHNVKGELIILTDDPAEPLSSLADLLLSFPSMWEAWTPIPYVVPLQLFAVHLGASKPPSHG